MKGVSLHLAVLSLTLAIGCSDESGERRHVVVFTAMDRVYSEPILREFQRRTGIAVRPVYDAEAAKTTGLVNRLIARRDDPECDVLWSNEPVQTHALAEMGLFQPYRSPSASRIPESFRDAQDRWTGFAARMRVILYHRQLLAGADPPTRLGDFLDPRWRGRAAIASPFYGTTFAQMSLLYGSWGEAELSLWLAGLRANGIVIAPGNGPVRDLVAAGECAFGLTDTDDAHGAILDGKPVGVVAIDGPTALLPNTVALIAHCKRPAEGRALIDYLLSAEVERALAAGRSAQIPLGQDLRDLPTPWDELLRQSPPAATDIAAAAAARHKVITLLRQMEMDR